MTKLNRQFALLFKKYRLRSEIETLAEFGDLLAQEGIVYENSIFTRWQNGDRVPNDRKILLNIIHIFIKNKGIQTVEEINSFLEVAGQGYITEQEIKKLFYPLQDIYQNLNTNINKKNSSTPLKVFFSGSYKSSNIFKRKIIQNIYNEIKLLKYEHLDTDFVNTSYKKFVEKMLSDRRELILHYYKKLNAIYKSDICIFETTYHSIGIGFLIQKAINEEKPTIVFHYEGKLSFFISGIVDKNLSIYEYNENNYRDVVKKAMEESRNKIGFNKLD